MKPKKKDRLVQDEPKSQFEQIQADHEMFLQAFEISGTSWISKKYSPIEPTQIYRFLRTRNVISPIYLNRCLLYMHTRSTRPKNTREHFKVDSMLAKVEAKHRKNDSNYNYKSEFMNLAFSGFFDQGSSLPKVDVEVFLVKICHKKRKDVSSPMMEVRIGHVSVPVNPEVLATPSKMEAVSVGSEHFSSNNGHMVKSYALTLRVTCRQRGHRNDTASPGGVHRQSEIHVLREVGQSEPSPKRRRFEQNNAHNTEEVRRPTECDADKSLGGATFHFGAELIVYDKHRRCLLTPGEYELALQDLSSRQSTKKQATWETIMDGKAVGPFEVFTECPTLKFKLIWNRSPLDGTIEEEEVKDTMNENGALGSAVPYMETDLISSLEHIEGGAREATSPSKRKRIFYQFQYNNNTSQQTEARDDLHCPWCYLNCMQLYALLKHLRTCHGRFNFTYTEHPKGARLDVSINECYDGSYVGNPQDLHSHIGYAFSRNGPVRRTPVTQVIVHRCRTPVFHLAEFLEPESDTHSTRQIVQGHNRLYFHAGTCQPVRPIEIDEDTENRTDPLWLRQRTIQMLEEFTDVNEGEKDVMKMWNLHMMQLGLIGDCQVAQACMSFVQRYGPKILERNLVKNFTLHLTNLYDFGIIRSDVIYKATMQLLQLRHRLEQEGKLTGEAAPEGRPPRVEVAVWPALAPAPTTPGHATPAPSAATSLANSPCTLSGHEEFMTAIETDLIQVALCAPQDPVPAPAAAPAPAPPAPDTRPEAGAGGSKPGGDS